MEGVDEIRSLVLSSSFPPSRFWRIFKNSEWNDFFFFMIRIFFFGWLNGFSGTGQWIVFRWDPQSGGKTVSHWVWVFEMKELNPPRLNGAMTVK